MRLLEWLGIFNVDSSNLGELGLAGLKDSSMSEMEITESSTVKWYLWR